MFEFIFVLIASLLLAFVSRKLSNPGLPAFIIFVSIGFYLFSTGVSQYKENWRVNHVYQQTTCTVTRQIADTPTAPAPNTKVYTFSSNGNTDMPPILCPRINVQYTAASQRLEVPLLLHCVSSEAEQTKVLSQYQVGQAIPCYVDPEDHGKILLSRSETSFFTYFLLIIGFYLIATVTYRFNYPKKPAESKSLFTTITDVKSALKSAQENQSLTNTSSGTDNPSTNQSELQKPKQQVNLFSLMFISLFVLGISAFLYTTVKDQWRVNHIYKPTTCKILDVKLNTSKSSKSTTYQTLFLARYQADGVEFNEWTPSTFDKRYASSSDGDERYRFKKDQEYPCWYDPDYPSRAVLDQSIPFIIYILAFFESITVLAFISMLREYFQKKKQ